MYKHLFLLANVYGITYAYHFVSKDEDDLRKHLDYIKTDYYLKQHPDYWNYAIIKERVKDVMKVKERHPELQNTFTVTDLDEFLFQVHRINQN